MIPCASSSSERSAVSALKEKRDGQHREGASSTCRLSKSSSVRVRSRDRMSSAGEDILRHRVGQRGQDVVATGFDGAKAVPLPMGVSVSRSQL